MTASTLFDFGAADAEAARNWRSVDDVVMGGVSESRFVAIEHGAAFTGTVSLDQGGGFASVRSPERDWDLSAFDGFSLRLRGDGKRYWFTSSMDTTDSVSYRAPVRPPSHWTLESILFDALTPYRRGSHVPDAPPFDPSKVRSIGFLIADEQAGPFQLEVAWVRAITS